MPLGAAALAAATLNGCAAPGTTMRGAIVRSYAAFTIRRPPAALKLDPFYTKYVDAEGIPIVASSKAPDAALLIARDIVMTMLSERPDIRQAMIRQGYRIGVMAVDEYTTDLPEQRDWKKPTLDDPRLSRCEQKNYAAISAMTDRQYWNERARGMGGLFTTGAAENLLGVPHTRYFGENIFVHEFSHGILSTIETVDPALFAKVRAAYDAALAAGRWKGDYAAVSVQEYWAEGTQFWFNSNKAYPSADGMIATSQDLRRYDPDLFALLATVYPATHHIGGDVFYMHPARLNVPARPDDDC